MYNVEAVASFEKSYLPPRPSKVIPPSLFGEMFGLLFGELLGLRLDSLLGCLEERPAFNVEYVVLDGRVANDEPK